MNMMRRVIAALGLVAAGAMAQNAFAQEDTVKVGAVYFDIHSKATDTVGPLTPPGANLKVDNSSTLGFSYTHLFDDHWGFSFLLGYPPKFKTEGRGALEPLGTISTARSVTPTFVANYYFGEKNAAWRPYVGAGVNYTKFTDTHASDSLANALGGPTTIHLDNSTGLALQIGLQYNLNAHWLLDANLIHADVKSTQTVSTGPIDRTSVIDFRPMVFSFNVGYRF